MARIKDEQQLQMLTRQRAAELAHVSLSTVDRWILHGDLQAYRLGPKAVRIRLTDLQDFLVARTWDDL